MEGGNKMKLVKVTPGQLWVSMTDDELEENYDFDMDRESADFPLKVRKGMQENTRAIVEAIFDELDLPRPQNEMFSVGVHLHEESLIFNICGVPMSQEKFVELQEIEQTTLRKLKAARNNGETVPKDAREKTEYVETYSFRNINQVSDFVANAGIGQLYSKYDCELFKDGSLYILALYGADKDTALRLQELAPFKPDRRFKSIGLYVGYLREHAVHVIERGTQGLVKLNAIV